MKNFKGTAIKFAIMVAAVVVGIIITPKLLGFYSKQSAS